LVSECTAALLELYNADLSPPISPVIEGKIAAGIDALRG